MTRLYSWGFENNDELETFTTLSTDTDIIDTPLARTGTKVLDIMNSTAYAEKYFSDNYEKIYFSGAVYCVGATSDNIQVVYFGTGGLPAPFGGSMSVRWRTGNLAQLLRGTTVVSSGSIAVFDFTNKWCVIEVEATSKNSGGIFTVKCNGVLAAPTYTGDTAENTENSVSGVRLYTGHNTAGKHTLWDDVCINNSLGTRNNTWIGMAKLQPIKVRASGSITQLARGGTDLGFNVSQVRDAGGESFVQGGLDEYDLYTVDNPNLPDGAVINNIIVEVAGQSTSNIGLVSPLLTSGSTSVGGTDQILTTAGDSIQEAWSLNPNTSGSWVEGDLSGLQIGVKVRS